MHVRHNLIIRRTKLTWNFSRVSSSTGRYQCHWKSQNLGDKYDFHDMIKFLKGENSLGDGLKLISSANKYLSIGQGSQAWLVFFSSSNKSRSYSLTNANHAFFPLKIRVLRTNIPDDVARFSLFEKSFAVLRHGCRIIYLILREKGGVSGCQKMEAKRVPNIVAQYLQK